MGTECLHFRITPVQVKTLSSLRLLLFKRVRGYMYIYICIYIYVYICVLQCVALCCSVLQSVSLLPCLRVATKNQGPPQRHSAHMCQWTWERYLEYYGYRLGASSSCLSTASETRGPHAYSTPSFRPPASPSRPTPHAWHKDTRLELVWFFTRLRSASHRWVISGEIVQKLAKRIIVFESK